MQRHLERPCYSGNSVTVFSLYFICVGIPAATRHTHLKINEVLQEVTFSTLFFSFGLCSCLDCVIANWGLRTSNNLKAFNLKSLLIMSNELHSSRLVCVYVYVCVCVCES
jgi:hypothetical protein